MDESTSITNILGNSIKDEDFLRALESFIDIYKEQRKKKETQTIPLSLFADRKLASLGVAVKYMKENLSLNYSQIAAIINRDQRTIWTTYQKAIKKHKEVFNTKKEEYHIPCEIFLDRTRGPLEAVVVYLKKDLNLSFKQISILLNRNYRTIWLSYKNGIKHDK